MGSKSVAVIGSGVSGMTAAYLLRDHFDVTVFEADSRLGGHVDCRHPEPGSPADMAFVTFNTVHYPNFTRLLKELRVATRPADMSTEVVCLDCRFTHLSEDPMGLRGLPRRPAGVSEYVWNRYVEDSERFVAQLREAIRSEPEATVEQFLAKEGFSTYFAQHFVYARLWGWLFSDIRNVPIGFLTNVLDRYGLLGGPEAFRSWQVVCEGSAAYIERIAAGLPSVKTSTPVRAVSRTADGVAVRDAAGNIHYFDKAVIAVHAPQALAMLTDPTTEQQSVLSAFEYTPTEVVLHADAGILPNESGRTALTIQTSCANPHVPSVSAHANMNRLRGQTSPTEYWVTYNPLTAVNTASAPAREIYRHPAITQRFAAAQRRLPALSDDVLAFAGAYHGDGFHESGCTSGIAAARALTGKDAATLLQEASGGVRAAVDRTSPPSWLKPRGLGTSAANILPSSRPSADELCVPELWCPIAPAIHPQAAQVEEHAITWMTRFGFITTPEEEKAARACRFGTLASRVYPRGPFDFVSFGCEMIICTFLIDDEYMERAAVPERQIEFARNIMKFTQILRAPDEQLPPGIPADEIKYHAGLQDLAQRWAHLVPSEQLLRWRAGIEEYFMATGAEVIYRSQNVMPSVDEYISLRESSVLQRSACLVVTEMTGLSPLPGHLFSDPQLQRIARTASRVIAWTNDILSGPRELRWPGAINLISVLANEHQISNQQALDMAGEIHTQETRTFMELSGRELRRDRDPRINQYITGLGQWIRGNLDWSRTTGRYSADSDSSGPQVFGA